MSDWISLFCDRDASRGHFAEWAGEVEGSRVEIHLYAQKRVTVPKLDRGQPFAKVEERFFADAKNSVGKSGGVVALAIEAGRRFRYRIAFVPDTDGRSGTEPPAEMLIIPAAHEPQMTAIDAATENGAELQGNLDFDSHLVIPVSSGSQLALRKLHNGLDGLPIDLRTVVLRTLARPFLEQRVRLLEDQVVSLTHGRGWTARWRRWWRAVTSPAAISWGLALLLTAALLTLSFQTFQTRRSLRHEIQMQREGVVNSLLTINRLVNDDGDTQSATAAGELESGFESLFWLTSRLEPGHRTRRAFEAHLADIATFRWPESVEKKATARGVVDVLLAHWLAKEPLPANATAEEWAARVDGARESLDAQKQQLLDAVWCRIPNEDESDDGAVVERPEGSDEDSPVEGGDTPPPPPPDATDHDPPTPEDPCREVNEVEAVLALHDLVVTLRQRGATPPG